MFLDVSKVRANGEIIKVHSLKLRPSIPEKHKLVAIVHNGYREFARDVTNPTDYNHYYIQYQYGYFNNMNLYQLAEELVPLCPAEEESISQ